MSTRATQDAAFFDLVHELIQKHGLLQERPETAGVPEKSEPTPAERRRAKRIAFSCIQLMAPIRGSTLPVQTDFQQVRCHDLSTHGFSFYVETEPDYDSLVMLLGKLPFRTFLAKIVSVRACPEAPGTYLVGCRIQARLRSDD